MAQSGRCRRRTGLPEPGRDRSRGERRQGACMRSARPAALSLIAPECNSFGLALLGGASARRGARADTGRSNADRAGERSLPPPPREDRWMHFFGLRGSPHRARSLAEHDHRESQTCCFPPRTIRRIRRHAGQQRGPRAAVLSGLRAQHEVRESWRWLRASDSGRLSTIVLTDSSQMRHPAISRRDRRLRRRRDFRSAGAKIPREPHRYSGRTAMTATSTCRRTQTA